MARQKPAQPRLPTPPGWFMRPRFGQLGSGPPSGGACASPPLADGRFCVDRLLLTAALGGRMARLPFVVALAEVLVSASATVLVSAPSPSVSSFLRLSLPASALYSTLKCLKKVWPSRGSTSPFSAGITAHSTFWTVNLPTRTEGMTSCLASTTVPSAVVNRTVGSLVLGFKPIRPASLAEMVVRPAPVSKTIFVGTLPRLA